MAKRYLTPSYIDKPKRKRKGIHSKTKNTNNKNGKYYTGTKYIGS
jgi:hypothetical protein